MTGSDTKSMPTTTDANTAPINYGVDLSRFDISAIEARARHLRAVETARLLRQAWLTIGSLWRGPRRMTSSTRHGGAGSLPNAGTLS